MRAPTFRCPGCGDDRLLLHWRDPDGSGECRTCAAQRRGECKFPHPHPANPCAYLEERPGHPCRWCGDPVPLNGAPCPRCWTTFDGMSTADIKALFAADAAAAGDGVAVFDVLPVIPGRPT